MSWVTWFCNVRGAHGDTTYVHRPSVEEQAMTTERLVFVADLQVGDYIKSFVDFIPPTRVTHAPRPRQHGMVDWVDTAGKQYRDGASLSLIHI